MMESLRMFVLPFIGSLVFVITVVTNDSFYEEKTESRTNKNNPIYVIEKTEDETYCINVEDNKKRYKECYKFDEQEKTFVLIKRIPEEK